MNYVGKMISSWKFLYNEINAATLTGAIDVVVVEQPDGTYTCSPFHVRFGKMGVLRSKEKVVDIEINGEPVDIHMKLGESGEAFFVEEVKEDVFPPHMACSPIPPNSNEYSPPDQMIRLSNEDGDGGGGGGTAEINKEKATDSEQQVTVMSTLKTFKPEKVEEHTVLEGSVDFRPITGQNSSTSLSGMDTDFAKEDSPSADERQMPNNSNSTNTNNKRKRRKKSTKKKLQQQKRNSASGGNFLVEECSSEAIFQLDDLDSPGPAPVVVPVTEVITELAEPKPLDLPGVSLEGHDIHFFSDTEITPGSSPSNRCSFGPIQSDSEFETKRLTEGEERSGTDEASQSQWKWGELPTSASIEDNKPDSQKWMIQSMLGFMKKTKHIRHKSAETDGIYLSDFNSDDTEMAALYFPKTNRPTGQETITDYQEESREEDAESGNGPSLPQSPHSVEGAICGPKSADFHQGKCYPEDIALSICGLNPTPEQFDEGLISYPEFVENPNILANQKLMVRFDGKYYPWKSAAPLLVSALIFNKPLPQTSLMRLSEIEEGEEQGKELKDKPSKKAYSWFNWSRNNPKYSSVEGTQLKEEIKTVEIVVDEDSTIKCEPAKRPDSIAPDNSIIEQPLDLPPQVQETPISGQEEQLKEEEAGTPEFNSDKYRKSLRLTSEQISSLNLHPGANEIQFSVTTAYQGTTKCKCFLFCWRYDDKIVVSDIDGTITKSDVLGHILPIVGKDWAQSGVAKLFTKIKDNGYKLLYLSARAIGQSRTTRDYLKSIKQEELGLPEGPMLLNPTSLLTAFHTEVIEKKPEEFKISCLRDIQALFPSHIKPFYAGYGNKINDVWSYQAVGIPIVRIFTINHRGELKHELTETFQSSYIGQSNIVNELFPPIPGKIETDCYKDEKLEAVVDIMVEDIVF